MATQNQDDPVLRRQQAGPYTTAPLAGDKFTIAGGEKTIQEQMRELYYPAVGEAVVETEEAKIPFTDIQFLGAGQVTNRYTPIEWYKSTPGVSVASVLPLDDEDYKNNVFMKIDTVYNESDQALDLYDLSYEDRIKAMDKFGAVRYEIEGSGETDIPWDKLVTKYTKFPEGSIVISDKEYNLQDLSKDEWKRLTVGNRLFSTLAAADPKVGQAVHAQYLNELLISQGIDSRGRAAIIQDAMATPTVDELSRVVIGAGETLGRGTAEIALWGIGEITDIVGSIMRKQFGIGDYVGRQAILDNWWKPLPYEIQNYYAQQNIAIDLQTAEKLAQVQTGFVPYATQIGIEFAGPTKANLARQGVAGAAELRAFQLYKQDKLQKEPDLTEDDLLAEYIEDRNAGLNRNGLTRFIRIPLLLDEKFDGVEKRIVIGLQIEDAAMAPELRAEVAQVTKQLSSQIQRRDGLVKRRVAAKRTGEEALPLPQLQKLDADIRAADEAIFDLQARVQATKMRSSIPAFVRDSNIQDAYLIGGASAFGYYFQAPETSITSEVGEMIGMGAALAAYLMFPASIGGQGGFPALLRMSKLPGSDKAKLKYLARQMSSQDPTIQDFLQFRADRMQQLQDVLIAKGVRPDLLDVSLPVLTDLVTLRHFSSMLQDSINVKNILSKDEVKRFQDLSQLNTELNAELNRVFVDFQPSSEGEEALFEMLRYMAEETVKGKAQLDNYVRVVEKDAVGHYLNFVNGNSIAVTDAASPILKVDNDAPTFEEALSALHSQTLLDYSQIPSDNFAAIIGESHDAVVLTINNAANKAVSILGTPRGARAAVASAAGRETDLPDNVTSGGLLSVLLESQHASQRAIASKKFQYLESDDIQYLDTAGRQLDAVPTVSVLPLFQGIINDVQGPFTALKRQAGKGPATNIMATADKTLVELTTPFFENFAARQVTPDGRTPSVAEIIEEQKTYFIGKKKEFPKGRNTQALVAQYIAEEAAEQGVSVPFFDVSPSQLAEIQRTLGQVQFRYRNQPKTFEVMQSASDASDQLFMQFEVDGVALDRIRILDPDSGQPVFLSDYMETAKQDWSKYKATWYDTNEQAIVPSWMSWGNRKRDEVSGSNPTGHRYNQPTKAWINLDDLADPVKSESVIKSLQRALGESVTLPGGTQEMRLVEGSANATALRSILRANLGEYLAENLAGKSGNELRDFANNLEKNLTVVDASGVEKPLLDVVSVIDDITKAGEKAYGKEVWSSAMKVAEGKVDSAISKALTPAKARQKDLNDADAILKQLAGPGIPMLDTSNVGDFIIRRGVAGLREVKKALETARTVGGKPRFTEQQVNDILANSYMISVQNKVFNPTGRKTFEKGAGDSGFQTTELEFNSQALRESLGVTDSQKAAVRELIGDERYETWSAILEFSVELEANPLSRLPSMGLKGAPRALSVESYISRLYAINRGVVRPQYVGTEALLQTMRFRNYNFVADALTNPEMGKLVLEMIRTGEPLVGRKNIQFQQLLLQGLTQSAQVDPDQFKKRNVVDPAGREFTVYATPSQKQRLGFPPTYTGQIPLPSLDEQQPQGATR